MAAFIPMGVLFSQDPLMRMDPDDWCQRDDVQQAIGILSHYGGAYQATISFDSGALTQIPNGYGRWTRRADDLRVVMDSNGVNVARSHNHGFNLRAYHFSWNDHFHSLGGMGFWKQHAMLIDFVPQTGEWELLPSENKPDFVFGNMAWLDQGQGVVMAAERNQVLDEHRKGGRPVLSLNLQSREWQSLGVIHHKLNVHFEETSMTSVELEDYMVWLAQHKVIMLRKGDLKVVVADRYNRKMWRSAIGKREAGEFLVVGARGGVVFAEVVTPEGVSETQLTWDIAALYEANEGQAFDFIVPGLDAADAAAEGPAPQGMPKWVWAGILLPLAFMAGRFSGLGRKAQTAQDKREDQRAEVPAGHGLSLLTRNFLDSDRRELDTAALNAFLGLDGDLSEETRRSRRAQAVRQVNQEYRLFCGQDLIYRVRDPNDRRRTTYFIRPDSDNA